MRKGDIGGLANGDDSCVAVLIMDGLREMRLFATFNVN